MFHPNLKIGQVVENEAIKTIYQCAFMGGMRRSRRTNTLVLIADHTRGPYFDNWMGNTLHYTGMGKFGDQDIEYKQNKTLAESDHNGVELHLFEVLRPKEYTYRGRVVLAGKPYTAIQPDEDGADRTVWIFPLCPAPDGTT